MKKTTQLWIAKWTKDRSKNNYTMTSLRRVGYATDMRAIPRFVSKYFGLGGKNYPVNESIFQTLKVDGGSLMRITKKGDSYLLTYAVPVPNVTTSKVKWNSIQSVKGLMKFFDARTLKGLNRSVAKFTDSQANIVLVMPGNVSVNPTDKFNHEQVVGFRLMTKRPLQETSVFYFPVSYEKMLLAADVIDEKYHKHTTETDEDAYVLAAVA